MKDKRRAIRYGEEDSEFRLLTKRDGFWRKVPLSGQIVIQNWVRNHPMVIHSPNSSDTLKVKVLDDVTGTTKVVVKNKLLLQW